MAFSGFGPGALPFFRALAFHQTKAWFEENRALYESDVKGPFGDLVEELSARFAASGLPLQGSRRGSLFRLNRDIRFARGKDLYKTHQGATLSRSGARMEPGLLYIHIDPQGCFLGAAFYRPEPDTLRALRAAIRRKPAAFAAMEKALAAGGLALEAGESLSRAPRGFEDVQDEAVLAAIRRKSFLVRRPVAEEAILQAAFADDVEAFAAAALPLLQWGWSALAESRA